MKLIPSIFAITAVTAQLCVAAPVRADSVWLIMKEAVFVQGQRFALGIEKLEMKDMEQCEEQGAIFMASERLGGRSRENYSGFECLEGK